MISSNTALDFNTEPIGLIKNSHKWSEWLWVVYFVLSVRDHYCFAEIRFLLYRRSNLNLLKHVSSWSAVSIGEDKSRLLLITTRHARFLYCSFQICTTLSVLVRRSTYTWLIQLQIFTSPCYWSRSILFPVSLHHKFIKVLFKEKRRSVVKSWWLYLHWLNYSLRFKDKFSELLFRNPGCLLRWTNYWLW